MWLILRVTHRIARSVSSKRKHEPLPQGLDFILFAGGRSGPDGKVPAKTPLPNGTMTPSVPYQQHTEVALQKERKKDRKHVGNGSKPIVRAQEEHTARIDGSGQMNAAKAGMNGPPPSLKEKKRKHKDKTVKKEG